MYGLLALFFMMHTLHASLLPPQDQLTEDEIKKRFATWNKNLAVSLELIAMKFSMSDLKWFEYNQILQKQWPRLMEIL